ncbi:hypothetical protein LIER_24866 [Lithospermum erythrorhizon]|uniref:Uncharacterized protein n=1 Tax=Lithospermum erythrorhizon TaxID=34254 RepID=A0AAV3R2P2_LITER
MGIRLMLGRSGESTVGLWVIREAKRDILGKTLTRGVKEEGSPGIWFHLGGEGFTKTLHVGPHGKIEEAVYLGTLTNTCHGQHIPYIWVHGKVQAIIQAHEDEGSLPRMRSVGLVSRPWALKNIEVGMSQRDLKSTRSFSESSLPHKLRSAFTVMAWGRRREDEGALDANGLS